MRKNCRCARVFDMTFLPSRINIARSSLLCENVVASPKVLTMPEISHLDKTRIGQGESEPDYTSGARTTVKRG